MNPATATAAATTITTTTTTTTYIVSTIATTGTIAMPLLLLAVSGAVRICKA